MLLHVAPLALFSSFFFSSDLKLSQQKNNSVWEIVLEAMAATKITISWSENKRDWLEMYQIVGLPPQGPRLCNFLVLLYFIAAIIINFVTIMYLLCCC